MAAILAAILDFSVSSRICACYPPDMHYRGPNYVESTIKKTISFHARYSWVAPWLLTITPESGPLSFKDLRARHIDDADRTQVAACHRLNQTADAPVIIRFCDLDGRDKWLQNAKRLRDNPRKISLSPDLSPVLRPIKKDLMAKRRSLSDDLKKRSSIRYLKSWPYVELKVNGHRHCESDITKNDIIKQFTDVNPVLKFDISDK